MHLIKHNIAIILQTKFIVSELAVVALFEPNGTPLDSSKLHEDEDGLRITPGSIIKLAWADSLEACEDCGKKHLMMGGMLPPDAYIAFAVEASKHVESFYETSLANFDNLETVSIVDEENAIGGEDFLQSVRDILSHK